MLNPFRYGGVVGRDAFCNRSTEIRDLTRAMRQGERLFVYSERRLGKTSLVRLAMEELSGPEYVPVYVDLWPTDGEESFINVTAKALTEAFETSTERMIQLAGSLFKRLLPVLTVDDQGHPQIRFEARELKEEALPLEEVLSAPARIADKRKCRVVMILDEFQRILEYKSDRIERTLRSVIQNQSDVSYIFLGSRKHLIQQMVLDSASPLYRAGGHYPLGPISANEWIPFIRERFERSDRRIGEPEIRFICDLTGGHPFYTQHLCHAAWELCAESEAVDEKTIESAVKLLLDRETYAYTALWESLTSAQRRTLIGLASEPHGAQLFGADFVRTYRLQSPSTVQSAVRALLDRDLVDRENGSFLILDRFFRLWIRRNAHRD
jgi:AAA+ ATPase superfamily predicted ATPase